ncbi:MAG: hypothetical protein MR460_16430 [Bilophila wadsworthia]|uniref:ParB N-terminal domain-containing protein n=1 Tax=Bilophila wadsworthia TaxID=35833 RepID=UPI00242E10E1|nr:ParB N-terminal domain-containing protein [Bilophila wadsworthia]MCI6541715.1 hypothetical protein [Bilophila wadsworthia]
MDTLPQIPVGAPSKIDISFLQLDYENPRLVDVPAKNDEAFITRFSKYSDLQEILSSMAENGYMDIEPLIVLKGIDKYIVLEGNRRLAALQLIRDADLAARCNINIPEIDKNKNSSFFKPITVYRVKNRESARAFIGFKHINGPHKWDSFAKGKYATLWYREGAKKGLTVDDIARQIGDSNDTISKMIKAYIVLEQALENDLYSMDDRIAKNFAFSHLYTALTRTEYCDFLGLSKEWRIGPPVEKPVSESYFTELRKVLVWLYGSKSEGAVAKIRTQNPDLAQLGKVIINPEARIALETGRSLAEAYLSLSPGSEIFAMDLTRADTYLKNALTNMASYEGGLGELAERVHKNATIIFNYAKSIDTNKK